MSVARYAARLGAAAFVLGVSLGSPDMTAVALADAGDGTASEAPGQQAPAQHTSESGRTARAPRPAGTRGGQRDPSPAAAEQDLAAAGQDLSDPPPAGRPVRKVGGEQPDSEQPDSGLVDDRTTPAPEAEPAAPGPDPARRDVVPDLPAATAAAPAAVAAPASSDVVAAPVTQPPEVPEPPVARAVATPRGIAALGTPAGAAASSFTDVINGLFAPIQSLFDGAALMFRRAFLNNAPTVGPLQLTGLSEGPITGTVGAVDPEGDPLSYAVTTAPDHGTVSVSKDGTYTYTPGAGFAGQDSFSVTATDSGLHINLLDLSRPPGTTAKVAVSQNASATPSLHFQFIYGAGSQFVSAAARAALESAAAKLASHIVVSAPVLVTYAVTAQYSPLSPTLANSSSDFIAPDAGFMNTVVQNKIQTGADANGSAPDGTIDWNAGRSWAYGDSVPSGQYDFQSIAMHELLHTFGFVSYIDAASSNTGKTWTVFDKYIVNSAGGKVISGSYTWNTAYSPNLTGGNGGLYFGGPNAVAANNGLVSLYTPGAWKPGSSISHLDDSVFSGSRRKLMNANVSAGTGIRTLSPMELGMLKDIGYQVSSGSGTSVLMVGLAFLRRMRRKD